MEVDIPTLEEVLATHPDDSNLVKLVLMCELRYLHYRLDLVYRYADDDMMKVHVIAVGNRLHRDLILAMRELNVDVSTISDNYMLLLPFIKNVMRLTADDNDIDDIDNVAKEHLEACLECKREIEDRL